MNKYSFSRRSLERLASCDEDLQGIMHEVMDLGIIDFSIVEGHRNQDRQNLMKDTGLSELEWPNSNHNHIPSRAVDVVPYVRGKGAVWNDDYLWGVLGGLILATAKKRGVELVWGGWHWKGQWDKAHFELG